MQLSELVRRIRRGEKEAVKELVAAYGSAVYQRAYERTGDRELAREAARQTFGQFVAIVQQQQEDDGWSLWFGDLIEKNISTYAQISTDMRTIENELDLGIGSTAFSPSPASSPTAAPEDPASAFWNVPRPEPEPPRDAQPDPLAWRTEQEKTMPRAPEEPKAPDRGQKPKERVHKDSVRDEIFDDPYRKKDRGRAGHAFSIVMLILVSLLLLWVVAGVAMTLQWIPYFDLGYTWFNLTVFKLF